MATGNQAITEFLESSPLYVRKGFPFIAATSGYFVDIPEINDHCEQCDQRRPFHNRLTGVTFENEDEESYTFNFTCVTCRTVRRTFLVKVLVKDRFLYLEKFGEWPRKKIKRDKLMQRFFKDDLDNFEKGMICLTHEYGVAAFAYFRRIVENNIVSLLKLVRDDAMASGATKDVLAALDELEKPGVAMASKISAANRALPAYLRPGEINPLGRLYATLSEGVHTDPDDECLKRAHAIQFCLAFLISELATRKQHRESFKDLIAKL